MAEQAAEELEATDRGTILIAGAGLVRFFSILCEVFNSFYRMDI